MESFHGATFDLLGIQPRVRTIAVEEIESAERSLGTRLPASVWEWYSYDGALAILAEHSNADPPVPLSEFELTESMVGRLIPIRHENQGVCTWAILLDGSEDPPVYVDDDSNGTGWQRLAPKFSTYVWTCVWDYHVVLGQPALVQAQNGPITAQALQSLGAVFVEQPRTFGWPGSVQYRFAGSQHGVLIWSTTDESADWFVGAADVRSLHAALRVVWDLDGVGKAFYECCEMAGEVLRKLQAGA